MKNLEYAGTSLEPKLPHGKNVSDWTISRDNTLNGQELCAWLAGIWDGEGWIGININHDKTRSAPFRHRPAIQLTTTDLAIYNRICDVLDGLGIKYYERHVKQDDSRKWKCHLHIVNRKNVLSFISHVYPYAVRLRPMLEIVLQYLQFYEDNKSVGGTKDPQSKFDQVLVFYDKLRLLRGSAKGRFLHTEPVEPSETTNRRLSDLRTKDDGIVRLLVKANG